MNTTIPESGYQDCVEELNEKLHDERKLSSDQNTRIAELEEQIGRMVDFVMEYENFILACKAKAKHRSTPGDTRGDMLYSTTISGVVLIWHELKAQHLDDKGE